ncbi:MAG: putative oxidoreductase [Chloroflexi bacterium]|nr:MAG: putative oxidoreductase [Chloroflexota bacterium]
MSELSLKNNSPLENIEIGTGTWAWGDRLVWGYGNKYSGKEVEETFHEAVSNGLRLFDTAETYGQGKSESYLGRLIPTEDAKIIIASKIMPFPWRLGKHALRNALLASLKRLSLSNIDLYQMHWPLPPVSVENWMNQMADVYEDGLISAVGVSNYNLTLTRRASDALKKRGISMVSNQVEYHLLEKRIEKNGLLEFCKENGIKVIAYSPLAMGILSGKYTPENPPRGARASRYNRSLLEKIQPLIRLMKKIGMDHDGKTASQVALNWVISKGAIPIPGAKNANQVIQNVGSLGWQLSPEEVNQLDGISDKVVS